MMSSMPVKGRREATPCDSGKPFSSRSFFYRDARRRKTHSDVSLATVPLSASSTFPREGRDALRGPPLSAVREVCSVERVDRRPSSFRVHERIVARSARAKHLAPPWLQLG